MDKVSIVVACYNASEYVYRCWESVKRQTYGIENIQCIFVDDASTDGGKTLNLLYKIEKEAPDSVLVVSSDVNSGAGGAVNKGISYSEGDFLQILDSDDELTAEAIESLHSIAVKYNTDIIQYNHTLILGNQRKVNKVSIGNTLHVIDDHSKRIEFLNATIVTYGRSNKFYSMKLIKHANVHCAENMIYEEPLFVYPLFLYAERVFLCEESYYLYYLNPGSTVTSKLGTRLLDHPRVQLMVLQDCMKRKDKYNEYKDVISCYFLWSYYCETLYFAAEHKDAVLPIDFLREMQHICRALYPEWRNNPQIKRIEDPKVFDILETIDQYFEDQKALNFYIDSLSEK